MAKAYDDRLDETIAFIRNTAAVPTNAAFRGEVADFCDKWVNKAPQLLQQQVSELISQGWTTDGGGKRNYRRALGLLDKVGNDLQYNRFVAFNAKELTNAQAGYKILRKSRGSTFESQLDERFEIFLGQVGSKVFLDDRLSDLKTDTLEFLGRHRLKISGSKGGRQTYKFSVYPDGNAGVTYGLQLNAKGFLYEPSVEVINVACTSFRDTKEKKNGLKGLDKIVGTEVKGDVDCSVMTTTQFTGCSFCMQKCGDGLVCAHMDPEGVIKQTGLTGPGIRGELVQKNAFGFDKTGLSSELSGDKTVYGCKGDDDNGWGYDQSTRAYMTIWHPPGRRLETVHSVQRD
jgi:hypothetical protein